MQFGTILLFVATAAAVVVPAAKNPLAKRQVDVQQPAMTDGAGGIIPFNAATLAAQKGGAVAAGKRA